MKQVPHPQFAEQDSHVLPKAGVNSCVIRSAEGRDSSYKTNLIPAGCMRDVAFNILHHLKRGGVAPVSKPRRIMIGVNLRPPLRIGASVKVKLVAVAARLKAAFDFHSHSPLCVGDVGAAARIRHGVNHCLAIAKAGSVGKSVSHAGEVLPHARSSASANRRKANGICEAGSFVRVERACHSLLLLLTCPLYATPAWPASEKRNFYRQEM